MKVQLNSVEDLTEYASWHDLTQKNRFFYVKNMRPFKSCEFLPLITKWAVFLQTHFGGWPLSSQAISEKKQSDKENELLVVWAHLLIPAERGSRRLAEWACHHPLPASLIPYNGPSWTPVSSWRTLSCHSLLPDDFLLHLVPKRQKRAFNLNSI